MFKMVQMVSSSSRMLALGLVAAVGIMAGAQQAHAFTKFFGEDANSSEIVPLGAFPTATAAQTSFLGALSGTPSSEDFEGFADGTPEPLGLFSGASAATLSGGGGAVNSVPAGSTNGKGRYGTSATNYYEVAAAVGGFTVAFADPGGVLGFGFFGVDIGDFGGQLTLLLTLVGGGTESVTAGDIPHSLGADASTGGSVLYFGILADVGDALITQVDFLSADDDGDNFAFDDFTVSSPADIPEIPEPSTIALFGIGLIGLGVALRRRRRSVV